MAMHIHSSFSEQYGSMDGQLYQAALNAVDVLWWSDHDSTWMAWRLPQDGALHQPHHERGDGSRARGGLDRG